MPGKVADMCIFFLGICFYPCPADTVYWIYPFLKTLLIQISWPLTKISDQDLQCFHSACKNIAYNRNVVGFIKIET